MRRIHGVREREKRNKRGPMQTSNKRGCKLSVLCDVANAKCDMQVQMRRRCRSPSSFYPLPPPPLSVHLSAWCPPLSARYLHPFTPALLSLSARRCPSVTPLLLSGYSLVQLTTRKPYQADSPCRLLPI